MRTLKLFGVCTLTFGLLALTVSNANAESKLKALGESSGTSLYTPGDPGPGTPAGPGSNTCPGTDEGTLVSAGGAMTGDTTGGTDDFGYEGSGVTDGGACDSSWYPSTAPDSIHTFTVDASGLWEFTTCGMLPTGWDTSIMILEDVSGGGCPGDTITGCDADDWPAACGDSDNYNWESLVQVDLCAGNTYYLLLDGYDTDAFGPYTVDYYKVSDPCTDEASCADGDYCNGVETCVDSCSAGGAIVCEAGPDVVCDPATPVCDNATETCVACGELADPDDFCGYDGNECNGIESCDQDAGSATFGQCIVEDLCDHPSQLCKNGYCETTTGQGCVTDDDRPDYCPLRCGGTGAECIPDDDCAPGICLGSCYEIGGYGTFAWCMADGDCPYPSPDGLCLFGQNALCDADADCDPGDFCMQETCNGAGDPCQSDLECPEYYEPDGPGICDGNELCENEPCVYDPHCEHVDDCTSWLQDTWMGSYAPMLWSFDHINQMVGDDIAVRPGGGLTLKSYSATYVISDLCESDGGSFCPGPADYTADTSLWTLGADCFPDAPIAGTDCQFTGATEVRGPVGWRPRHTWVCDKTGDGVVLPAYDENDCTTGMALIVRLDGDGARSMGPSLPGSAPRVFWPAVAWIWAPASDGSSRLFLEDVDDFTGPLGTWGTAWFGLPIHSDLDAELCTEVCGPCCLPDFSCANIPEQECLDASGLYHGDNLPEGDPAHACGADADTDGVDDFCDNCIDDANPDQKDCNDDGQGNACEDPDEQDDDGDGVCNGADGCPADPGKSTPGTGIGQAPGQCGCGNPDDDADGDLTADCIDGCVDDPLKTDPGTCGCGTPDEGDEDGDGVLNCVDECKGVDDATFAPECEGAIPTVSEWGILILALLLLAAGKVYFGRRKATA